jgi:hypothetical protein
MNDIALSSLRVAADIDASKYKTGADQKVASDRAMVASAQAVGSALSQTDTKISTAGDSLAKLSRQYLDGYKNQERFEQGLRQIGRQLDSGKTDLDGATRLLVGMNQKLGLTADVSQLAAKGQTQLAAAVSMANTQIEGQAAALQQAAAAHAALIAQARADQAAENSRQIGAANQNSFNNVLGVTSTPAAGARASASVFEAEFTRLDGIAQLKATQIGQNFGADLSASLVGATQKSAREAASVFEIEMDRIDQIAQLKAQQAGGYFAQDFNARMGIGRKVNSAQESASVFANAPGSGGPRLSSFQMQGLGYQANDVVTMALLGAPASQIAFSQGGQILQNLQMGEGGIAGSLSAIKGGAAAAGTALFGTLGVVGSIATGFGVAAVAAGAFYLLTRDKTKDLNDALKEQRQAVLDVAGAYDLAKVSSDNYNKSRGIYAGAAARQGQSDLGTSSRSEDIDVLNKLASFETSGQTRGGRFGFVASGQFEARSRYSAFSSAIDPFARSVNAGTPDYDALAKGVQAVVLQNPGLKTTGDEILNIAKAGNEAAAALKEGADALTRINSRAPSLADSQLGQDYRDQNGADLTWLQRQQAASLGSIGAKSPGELRQAAMAAEAAKPSAANESYDVTQYKIASVGALAYTQALHQLKEAQDQRLRSLDQTLASAKLDIDLIGKTTAATKVSAWRPARGSRSARPPHKATRRRMKPRSHASRKRRRNTAS